MKVLLKDGTEYQINSSSIISDNRIQISFAGITSYDTLRAALIVSTIKTLKIYTSDTSYDVYENYTKILDPCSITTASDGTLDVVIILERESEISQRITQNEQDIAALYDSINTLLIEIIPTLIPTA